MILPSTLAAGGGFDPLTFDPAAFLLTFITFAVLLLCLKKWAWGPILQGIEARESRIEGAIKKAEDDRETAEHMLAGYKQSLANVESEIAALKEKGQQEADALRRQILAAAEQEANERSERALREIELARSQAVEEIRQLAVSIGMTVASKVVGRSLESEDHLRLAAGIVDDLGSLPAERN